VIYGLDPQIRAKCSADHPSPTLPQEIEAEMLAEDARATRADLD